MILLLKELWNWLKLIHVAVKLQNYYNYVDDTSIKNFDKEDDSLWGMSWLIMEYRLWNELNNDYSDCE